MFTSNVIFFQKAIVFHPEQRRFLALKRSGHASSDANRWDLPGGGVDFGELHLPAIEREIREETGLIVGPLQVVEVMTWFDTERERYKIFVAHQCHATSTEICLSSEHTSGRWVTPREWIDFDAPEPLKHVVKLCVERKG